MTSDTPTRVSSISLSYIKEAPLGETLTVLRSDADSDGRIFVRTLNERGEVCLEAAFTLTYI
jgi:hypothetical protein